MIIAMIVLFVIGYLCIASEHVLHINKATFALILCGVLWAVYATYGHDPNLSEDMITALGDTCEIVVFLIGAMTIVELIDRYSGFNIIVRPRSPIFVKRWGRISLSDFCLVMKERSRSYVTEEQGKKRRRDAVSW